jgi:hypothetical protein
MRRALGVVVLVFVVLGGVWFGVARVGVGEDAPSPRPAMPVTGTPSPAPDRYVRPSVPVCWAPSDPSFATCPP